MTTMSITAEKTRELKVLVSAIAKKALPEDISKSLIAKLKEKPDVFALALATTEAFDKPDLKRSLNLAKSVKAEGISLKPDFQGTQVSYQGQIIGQTKILFKSSLPGELQARLAIESAIDRFLEYLQKVHQIVVLDESDRHVQLFIPNQPDTSNPNFEILWNNFIEQVAFSTYGLQKYRLPGLAQTFISMLKSVTLSGRGFSTLEVPILNQEQANVLAGWYFAVWRETKKRQDERQRRKINVLAVELKNLDPSAQEYQSTAKKLQDAEEMQLKEAKKYKDNFQKLAGKLFEEQSETHRELALIDTQLQNAALSKTEVKNLQKQQKKLQVKIILSLESVQQKLKLMHQSGGNPLEFVELDQQQHPHKFKSIAEIAKNFDKTATDQINGTRGDIFSQCITEMYRLLEMTNDQFDPLPPPLLMEQPVFQVRSPGDESKEFCYSCGIVLDPKTAKWQVLRFMFERPSQRRQSASSEGRPHICASCAALAFASPLKVTDESIVLKLEPATEDKVSLKLKDYLRMLTNKELHLSAGKYIVLAADKTQKGDSASQKLGQVQYAKTKAASILPREVLNDFNFYLLVQGSEIPLLNRHLIFIKGLLENYGQSIVVDGKEVNKDLGVAVRYVEQDLPVLAEYKLAEKENSFIQQAELEQVRAEYYQRFWRDVKKESEIVQMNADKQDQSLTRAQLYRDVAALTGLTMPFAEELERTVRDFLTHEAQKQPDKYTPERIKKEVEREVGKLIEEVHNAPSFCYYAAKGDDHKKSVSAKLFLNRENHFIYQRVKELLEQDLKLFGRENQDQKESRTWLNLYANDILMAYAHFADIYADAKAWKDLTYQLKLFLYTHFPELVRKLKSSREN